MKWKFSHPNPLITSKIIMSKAQRNIFIVGILAVLSLALLAIVYKITKLPEEVFVKRFTLAQMDFTNLESFEEAALALQIQEESFLLKELKLSSERGELIGTIESLGVDPQTEAAVQELLKFMADSTDIEKIKVYLFGRILEAPIYVDELQVKAVFAETEIEQGVKNAEYFFENGTVLIAEEQVGYGIDTEALAMQLQSYWTNNFEVPQSDEIPLRLRDPEIRTADLQSHLAEAQAVAAKAYTLQDEDGSTWELPMAEHIAWLLPAEGQTFTLNQEAFITYVELSLVPEVEQDPMPVIITENEDGTYAFHGSARFGREIDKMALALDLEAAINGGGEEPILMAIQTIEPSVTVPASLRERGITDLIGVGYSTYKSSPANRIANVNYGFEVFNGILLEQGAEFSFTSLMGPIDAAHGWLPELVIKGDETIPEYGGGLCQVSSTMFRAALYSGLPITARKNHSYAVSYYAYPNGYGLDATIYDPNPDLKFVNDTQGDILIQGYTDGFDAYFVFYGTYDGRRVKMEGPYAYDYTSAAGSQVIYTDELDPGVRVLEEYAHTGFKVDWYRTILYADGTASERENIHSNYEARPAKYTEGIAVDESTGADE